jgi:hypothetical protein
VSTGPGCDHVDADARRAPLAGQHLAHQDDAGLGGAIGHPARIGADARRRGQIDDRQRVAHLVEAGAAGDEAAGQIDVEDLAEDLGAGLLGRDVAGDAGAIDETGDRPEGIDGLGEAVGHLLLVGDIAGERQNVLARQAVFHPGDGLGAGVKNGNGDTFVDQRQRGHLADAGRATGDNNVTGGAGSHRTRSRMET